MNFERLKVRNFGIIILSLILFVQCGSDESSETNSAKRDNFRPNDEIQSLGAEFFEWRSITQPASGDDIQRVE